MSFQDRVAIYRNIETLRGRPLVAYVTSSRANGGGMMAADVLPLFARQLLEIDSTAKAIDLLIVSTGGDPMVSWRVASMLRDRFEKVGALLPYAAYSAATLLALGADEIVMHPFSNMGPVDPQLTYQKRLPGQDPETIHFGSEDLRNFLEFVRTDVGISDQEQLERAFELVCKDVGSIPIGVAKRSAQLALSLGEKLLSLHMGDKGRARAIAEALNKSFFHHGYPVARVEAAGIGLPVIHPQPELEGAMWSAWEDIESEMQCGRPFTPVELVFSDPNLAAMLSTVPQVQMPANLPAQLAQQVLSNVLQQVQVVATPHIEYTLFQAALESVRASARFETRGRINAVRQPDMNLAINVLPVTAGWSYTRTATQEVHLD
ncbi:MAG: hypothetical protein EPN53_14270 [Acidobacteria bacterium]|nr:MAG: hypothetical protein EPN53_14270 [Acidobacteriota bacterium]